MNVIRGYHHHDGSVGVLLKFKVGSDFTARTPEFKAFADGVLMSIACHLRYNPDALEREIMPYEAEWVGEGDHKTILHALNAACEEFQEHINIVKWAYL